MNITEVLQQAGPQRVTISGWNGKPVEVKLRRPSMIEMMVDGQIPNPLLSTVGKLFQAQPAELAKLGEVEQARAMHCIAQAALVEPTMAQLKEAGVSLTDDQYMQIYAYVLGGAAALERFRLIGGAAAGEYVRDDAREAQCATGD